MLKDHAGWIIRKGYKVYTKQFCYVEKCSECRREKENGIWIVRETKVTTSKYCPECLVKKQAEFDDFIRELDLGN